MSLGFFAPLAALAAQQGESTGFFSPGGILFDLRLLLTAFAIGCYIACIVSVIVKRIPARFLQCLIRAQCGDPKSAKTLEELGIKLTPTLRRALADPLSPVRKLVHVACPDGEVLAPIASLDDALNPDAAPTEGAEETAANADAADPEACYTEFDPREARYFLDDTHRRRAEIRYETRGSGSRVLIGAFLLLGVLLVLLLIYLPKLLELLELLATALFGE